MGIPYFSPSAANLSISAATPNICTGIIAFVRGVTSFSAEAASRLSVSSSSPKTGTASQATIASTVAMKVKGEVMTSSPGFIQIPLSAVISAAVPLESASAYFDPVSRFAFSSKSSAL